MEIMRETPWSRIRGQNIVYKEFLETVGNAKPTGSVLKETIVVSATISISVEKWHSRIRLRILSCSRMSENHREPENPGEEVPVVECLDGLARITLEELAPIHSVKSGILQYACSTSGRMDADLGKSALMRIARLMNRLTKGPNILVTKVQWLCWKLHDNWVAYSRIWSRRSLHRFYGRAQTYGNQSDVFDSPKPWYVMLTFETKNPSLGMICPGEPHRRNPQCSKFWGSVSGRDRVARARCPRSSVEAGLKYSKQKNKTAFSHLRRIGVCLRHHILNLRNENLLSTPARQCIWSAKRTWTLLNWKLTKS